MSERSTTAPLLEAECNALPLYLRVMPEFRVVLCKTHGCCYTRQNLSRHLLREHQLKGIERKRIESSSQLYDIAISITDVVQPRDGSNEIRGLPSLPGFLCHFSECNFRSINVDEIQKHYNKEHQWKVASKGAIPWKEAYMQSLFQQSQCRQYFAVILADQVHQSSNPQYIYPRGKAPHNSPISTPPPVLDNALDQIMGRYQRVQSQPQRDTVEDARHVSELTPWMKRTSIQIHLSGLEFDKLGPSYSLPSVENERLLFLICESVGRVLQKTIAVLVADQNVEARVLSRRNARLLNTFRSEGISQIAFSELQNQKTRRKYIEAWKRLMCYWERVQNQGHLRDTLFKPSDRQLEAWCVATDAARELASQMDLGRDEVESKPFCDRLDKAVLEFSIAIIQHSVPHRKFDSVLVSYAAVCYWSPKTKSWLAIGNYTSFLSQLIYDCQTLVLAQVLAMAGDDRDADIGAMIVEIRDQWLLNDTEGPFVELQENRLFGMLLAKTEVPPAQIRWYADGETLVYQDVIFHLSDLHRIIFEGIAEARKIFDEELCLSGHSSPACDIPSLDLRLLVDNWDATSVGHSFLTDSRNSAYLDPLKDWLFTRVVKTQALFNTFWSQTAEGNWEVSADAVQQYENAVQRFLQAIMVPFFIGSGQQARRPEFISIKWRNTTLVTRELFLHDGQMLFVLSYHKARSRTNGSRWIARFLLPEVAQLITLYLALVQPFRKFLHDEKPGSGAVSDYLWSRNLDPWRDDAMTQIVVGAGELILGKKIDIRAWRQITIGIAIQKFKMTEANKMIDEGGDDEEMDPALGSMSDVLHWQAGHNPNTGNRFYGGTVDFRGGLTDAGLQQFRFASELWHHLVRNPMQLPRLVVPPAPSAGSRPSFPRSGTANHVLEDDQRNGESVSGIVTMRSSTTPSKRHRDDEQESPLVQRIARRWAPAQTRRQWTMDQAMVVLQKMYGPNAAYRSSGQQKAMEYVLAGSGQVLAILRTNEGKSLLYLLPCQLPLARTTVVILPLVVLKAEMERRCKVAGIKAHVWGPESDPNKLHSSPLVIVAVEQAVGRRFQAFLNRLHVANGLDRVVYDECHVAITAATYRISMELLPMLRQLPVQTIFLTGTMPPSMVPKFEKKMLLRGARLVRSSTMRRDIHFQVSECGPKIDFVHDFSVPRIQEVIRGLAAGTRAIFYCSLKDVVEEVALAIDAPMYHSTSDNVKEKAKVLEQWRAGKPPYIVATSAFGMGIDHPKVRSVVHVGVPWSAIDFAQEVGRLGRDGDGGQSTALVPHLWKDTTTDRNRRPLDNAEAAMHSYLSTTSCRVLELSRYLDGEGGSPCIPESPMCDQCRGAIAPSVGRGHSSAMTESNDDLEDLQAGAELLQTRIQTQARGLADYTASLETWRGICMICYHLPGRASGQAGHARHDLLNCPNKMKYRFYDAKNRAKSQGDRRGGWFRPFNSCYTCFNPQFVCDLLKAAERKCYFADLVMPTCWAIFQNKDWVAHNLDQLGGGHVAADEAQYMLWLGDVQDMYGKPASGAFAVADLVFSQMDQRR